MTEPHKKNKLLLIEGMFAVMLLIFLGAFALNKYAPTPLVPAEKGMPSIVGFVPIEIKSQPIDITASEPTSFVLFSDKEDAFELTSLRLSGEVTGEGRAEIVLDNGLGQQLLIYSNVKQKQGNMITGMAAGEAGIELPEGAKVEDVPQQLAWLVVSPTDKPIKEDPLTEVGNDQKTVAGQFQHSCVDTCYMSMKMQKGLYYNLKVRVDPGTTVKINELKYTLEV